MSLIQPVSGTPVPQAPAEPTESLTSQLGSMGMMAWRELLSALGLRFDPAPAYVFYVELSGVLAAMFTECSGLAVRREVEEVIEGGVNDRVHKLPGRITYENIVLKRGLGLSRALWDWFMKGRYDFQVKRINFSIIQGAPGYNLMSKIGIGSGYGKVKHWDVENAYPVRWELSTLSTADTSAVVIETLEVAHHGISLSYNVATPLSVVQSIM